MTIANDLYLAIDIEGDIPNQVENYCALRDHLVQSFITGYVIFIDTSAISYDAYSIVTGGN